MGFSEATTLGNCLRCDDAPVTARDVCRVFGLLIVALLIGIVLGSAA